MKKMGLLILSRWQCWSSKWGCCFVSRLQCWCGADLVERQCAGVVPREAVEAAEVHERDGQVGVVGGQHGAAKLQHLLEQRERLLARGIAV